MKYRINDLIITPNKNVYKVCGFAVDDFGEQYQLSYITEDEWDGHFTLGRNYVENLCRRATKRQKAELI
jgi:hypothetical protein